MKKLMPLGMLLTALLMCLAQSSFAAPASEANKTVRAGFDVMAETDAYLATIDGEERAKSDAYFEGGYWLLLWTLVCEITISWLLLRKGFSARIRDWTTAHSRGPVTQSALHGVVYVLLSSVLLFPWILYTEYFREHQYALATQSFGPWFKDYGIELLVNTVLLTGFIIAIYAVVRRTGERWWLWGSVVTAALLTVLILISPVFIAPLFNEYKPLDDPKIEAAILSMAAAQNVQFDHVYMFDASAQTNRVSANVSGIGATKRISLNDNLLNQGSLAEIKAVMGHELGHYVLDHAVLRILQFSLVLCLGFYLGTKTYSFAIKRWETDWRITGFTDTAGLPLAAAILSVYIFLMIPVLNTIIRVSEAEADRFGLEVAREPEGAATIALKVAQYRKLDPGPVEEILFYDHPSGRSRIRMAMEWKAAHLEE